MLPFRRKPLAPSAPPAGSKAIFFGESTFEFQGTVTVNGISYTGQTVPTLLSQRFGWNQLNAGNYAYYYPLPISGGTYTLGVSVNGGTVQTTATIAWNDTAATVQTKLQALSNIGSGNVLVTSGGIAASGTSFTVTPIGALFAASLTITFNSASLTPNNAFSTAYAFTIPNSVTGGTYTISWNPGTGLVTSATIAYNAAPDDGTANSIRSKMGAMSNIGGNANVRVFGFGQGNPVVVVFQGTLAGNQAAFSINAGSLTPLPATPAVSPYIVHPASDPPTRAAVGSTTLQTHALWSSTDTRPNVSGAGAVALRVTQFNPDVVVIWYCANEYLTVTNTGAANPITAVRYAAAWDTVLTAINALASKPTVIIIGMQPLGNPLSAYGISVPDWSNFPASDALGSRDVIDQFDQIMRAKAAQYNATYVYIRDMPAALMQGDLIHPTNTAGFQWVADRVTAAF